MRNALILLFSFALLGCCQLPSPGSAYEHPPIVLCDVTKGESSDLDLSHDALKRIAVGMAIEQAKARLEAQRFTCKYRRDDYGHPYLDCRLVNEERWFISDTFEVELPYDEGKVTRINARRKVVAL